MSTQTKWFVGLLAVIVGLVAATVIATPGNAVASGDATIPPGGDTYGQSYADWADEWWNWALARPSQVSPVLDTTGQFGHAGQGGPVWYLAGTEGGSVERTLTVPPGKAFFFPLINSAWWVPEDGSTEADVRAIANYVADQVDELHCTLDGEPCTTSNLSSYRAESEAGGFALHIRPNTVLTERGYEPGDREPSVSDGYYVMLAPLAPGVHELNFGGGISDWGFAVQATYHLTVAGQ